MAAKIEKNKTEISQRITEIKTYFCDGNNTQFAAKLGIKEQYASNICNGTKSTGSKILDKILDTFPEVSRPWLFFGEGSMLRTDNSNQHGNVVDNCGIIVQHGDHSTYNNNNNTDLVSVVRAQQETINRQADTISTLTETNRQQSEQIGKLIEMLSGNK